jgi:type IV secretory pathway VirB10-like protein
MSDPSTDPDPPKTPSPEAEQTDAAAEDALPKDRPGDIELRAKPRPVTRINRRMPASLSAAGGLLLFGVVLVAIDPPTFREEAERRELFRTENTPTPEGLEALPRRYSDLPPPDPPPQLGPPLPGDLGQPIVAAERDLGIVLPETSGTTFRSDPEADAERAERIRQARLADSLDGG